MMDSHCPEACVGSIHRLLAPLFRCPHRWRGRGCGEARVREGERERHAARHRLPIQPLPPASSRRTMTPIDRAEPIDWQEERSIWKINAKRCCRLLRHTALLQVSVFSHKACVPNERTVKCLFFYKGCITYVSIIYRDGFNVFLFITCCDTFAMLCGTFLAGSVCP